MPSCLGESACGFVVLPSVKSMRKSGLTLGLLKGPEGNGADGEDAPGGVVSSVTAPAFTTVTGGAYFFLPGIRALRFLADGARATSEATASLSQNA